MPNRNSILIGLFVLIALVGGILLFTGSGYKAVPEASAPVVTPPKEEPRSSSQTQTGAPAVGTPEAPPQVAVITYTNSGFSPSMITVKKGTAITFKNESSQPFWPASAMHPTHRSYPTTGGCLGSTFDACAGIPPGGAWSFTFDIVGSWGYHDHLNARHYGKVIVQ